VASHKRNSSAEQNAAAGVAKDTTPDTNPEGVGGPEIVSGEGFAGDPLQKLQAEKQEMMNTLVRRQADFENFKKRVEKEKGSK
jgi:molecular chaperone GrpE (heat shock protein)